MSTDAYARLEAAHPEAFRNLVFQDGVGLAREVLAEPGREPADAWAMVEKIEAAYRDMAERSPNEWIRREAAARLVELAALRG